MRIGALLVLTLSAVSASAQEAGPPSPARQVIDAERLRAAGVLRLSDVLRLLDDWAITSVEGFTWRASPRGLGSFEDSGWIVMVGEQRIGLELFGVRSLDRLPITITQLDSVEVLAAPQQTFGQLADRGVIRFHLREPGPGVSLSVLSETANETGDPGPFRFTPLETPNIDRIGSGVFGTVGYAMGGGYVEVAAGWRERFVTDPPIRRRNFDITTEHHPIIVQSAASLRAGWDLGDAGRHRLLLGRTWTRDYFFLPAFGREVPSESPFTHLGLDGNVRLSDRTGLRYRAAYETNELADHPNDLGLDFDFRLDRWNAALEATHDVPDGRIRLGAGWRGASAETRFDLSDDDLQLLDLYAEAAYRTTPSLSHRASVSLAAGGEEVGFRGLLAQEWRPGARHRVIASLAYSERLPEEDERVWLWQRRGYGFLAENGIDVTFDGEPRTARLVSGDVGWRLDVTPSLRLDADAYLRIHSDVTLDERDPSFDRDDGTFSGPIRVSSGLDGQIAGGGLSAHWRPLPGLAARGGYRYQAALGGDDLFKDTWRAVPRNRFDATLLYTPVPNLTLWGTARFRSPTFWNDYRGAAERSDGAYRERVDESFTLDLAAQKWFWRRRLRLHIAAYNILDDPTPFHPIGVAYGLSFLAQLELNLGDE